MSSFPSSFDASTKALSKEVLGEAAADAIDELAARGYEVHIGLTPEFADAIAAMALEPGIREFCPNDSGNRFANRAATEQWLSKERGTFLLLKKAQDGSLNLAGYGWAGNGTSQHVPGGETTFAIRIGEAGQGQGLATPFAALIVIGSTILYGAENMWLETWRSNSGATHVYHKIGFVDIVEEPGDRLTASGEKVSDTRLYMSLASNDKQAV